MNFLSTPTFEKEVKKLAKKYPRIKDDLGVLHKIVYISEDGFTWFR
jgi:hypothetical protein